MIGMMYLVLTALLAMNVSKDILNAFVIINEGLHKTNENFAHKNEHTFAQFESAYANDPQKVGKYYEKAKKAKEAAETAYEHIEELKHHLIAVTSGKASVEEIEHDSLFDLKNVDSKDNYDIPTTVMIGSEPNAPKEGEFTAMELKDEIVQLEATLLGLFDKESDRNDLELGLDTEGPFPKENGVAQTWITANFYHLPLAAVITNLSKMQADIRNAEADVVKALFRNVDAGDFKFDTLAAKVIPRSTYVIQGDSFMADVFVAAWSKTQKPRMGLVTEFDEETGMPVWSDFDTDTDTSGIIVKNGMAHYGLPANSVGEQSWGGVIQIKGPDGKYSSYNVPKQTYTVAKPSLVVSPTAMNVFYRGLDNPVEVSVPGVPTEDLKVSISNLVSKTGTPGSLKLKPGKGKECVVSVSAEINGHNQNFGKKTFRVKNVPDPKPYFGGKTGSSTIPGRDLLAAPGVIAKMENFEFDLKFQIVSYTVSATIRGNVVDQPCKGPALSPNAKKVIKEMKSGSKLYIEKIKAKGPDGTVRDLGTIALKVI